MKAPKTVSLPLAIAALLLGKLTLPAQDWQTVDDFAIGSGDAEAHGVATDAAGGIYVVGTANGHAIVRYSPDDGSSWITRDDFLYPSQTNYNVFNAVTVDNQGGVYVGGTAGGYGTGHWIVRRSTDKGVSWETVDDYWRPWQPPETPGIDGVVHSLSSDGQGRIYAAGPMIRTYCPCYNTWWVRGSSIGGTNWDDKLVMPSDYGRIGQATCAGDDVYATGSAAEGYLGLILRSSDHGATWTAVFEGPHDFHNAITADSVGNLYSAGYSATSTSIVWLVRQAAPGGTNWTTLDNVTYANLAGEQAFPSSIAVDAGGNVCVTGQLRESAVIYGTNNVTYGALVMWFTRQYSVAADTWSTTDLFSYSTNMDASANGVAFAQSGSLFAVGYATSDSGQRRWLVRKRAAPTPLAQARALENEVNDLIARSAIARGPARVLLAIVDRTMAQMQQGESASVCNSLSTFTKIVQQFVAHGTLAQSDGQLLINGTDNVKLLLGCPKR